MNWLLATTRRPRGRCTRLLPRDLLGSSCGVLLAIGLAVGPGLGAAPVGGEAASELADLSLEELMSLEVTSVSRKGEQLFDTAAAVYVLTGDDIRRSGATSIPEALRLVPGVSVARINANEWAVTARGHNGRFANKLLVVIDGRTAYSPFFGGVLWDQQAVALDNIERIEVVRGPGGTIWGANAVNGVINIITRSAYDASGTLVSGRAGSDGDRRIAVRHGGEVGRAARYRISGQARRHGAFVNEAGGDGHDDWSMASAAFRLERRTGASARWMLDASAYDGEFGGEILQYYTYPTDFGVRNADASASGGHVLTEWSGGRWRTTKVTVRAFYNRDERDEVILAEERDTGDAELQVRHEWGSRHEIMWGLGARISRAAFDGSETAGVRVSPRTDHRWSGFLQDDITLTPQWRLVVGSKFEHNSYSGMEVQPNVRLAWSPAAERLGWVAVSRAVRTPAFFTTYTEFNGHPVDTGSEVPGNVRFVGNPELDSENVVAAEAGFRTRIGPRLLVDVAAFHNWYDDIGFLVREHWVVETSPPPLHVVVPFTTENVGEVQTDGVEVALEARLGRHWRLTSAYSYLHNTASYDDNFSNILDLVTVGDPAQQGFVRASGTWASGFELDAVVRYVDAIENLEVSSYTTVDLRLGFRRGDRLEAALLGRNLLDEDRIEFHDWLSGIPSTRVPRSVHGTLIWRF
jgi:iron complex outermembrane receptor protein